MALLQVKTDTVVTLCNVITGEFGADAMTRAIIYLHISSTWIDVITNKLTRPWRSSGLKGIAKHHILFINIQHILRAR